MKIRKQIILTDLIVLVLYNVIALLIPNIKSTTFWIAYVFSNLSIIISGLVVLGVLDKESIKSKFNNMPVVYVALTYTILQLIMGFVEIFSVINYRYSILINVVILGFSIIALSIANTGKNEIERVENKVKEKVFFIKDLQADIELFANKITDNDTKKQLDLLAESIRYSDPMSHAKLATIENQINTKAQELISKAEDDIESIKQHCDMLQQLIAQRNVKAKMYKNEPEETTEPQKPLNFKMIIAVIITISVLILIAITLYFTIIIPNKQYDEAMNLYNNKQYLQAQNAFKTLGNYKDSEQKQLEVMYAYATELLSSKDYEKAAEEFDKLGNYNDSEEKKNQSIYENATKYLKNKDYTKAAEGFMQLDDYKDSKEKVLEIYNLFGDEDVVYLGTYNETPIAWQIFNLSEHEALLITKDSIEEMAYNTEYKSISWEDSTLRKWLNEEFINSFDEKEKSRLLTYASQGDKVFLLSDEDVKVYKKIDKSSKSWWLRSNGEDKSKAMYVEANGTINTSGDIVTKLHGIRPAIWLSLD